MTIKDLKALIADMPDEAIVLTPYVESLLLLTKASVCKTMVVEEPEESHVNEDRFSPLYRTKCGGLAGLIVYDGSY